MLLRSYSSSLPSLAFRRFGGLADPVDARAVLFDGLLLLLLLLLFFFCFMPTLVDRSERLLLRPDIATEADARMSFKQSKEPANQQSSKTGRDEANFFEDDDAAV